MLRNEYSRVAVVYISESLDAWGWILRVTMDCISPHSVSSQIAASSRACLLHHAVLSGICAGTTVPNHFEKESDGFWLALPNFLRPACAKNKAFLLPSPIEKNTTCQSAGTISESTTPANEPAFDVNRYPLGSTSFSTHINTKRNPATTA